MKNKILIIVLLITALIFSACSTSENTIDNQNATQQEAGSQSANSNSGDTVQQPANSNDNTDDLTWMQLIVGTLKLENSDYSIDAEQAAAFLPLWKATLSLSQSDNTASAEIEALRKQIAETFTPEQIQTIQEIDISGKNMRDIFQELGIEFSGGGGGFGNLDPDAKATAQAARESGQVPQGRGRGSDVPIAGGGPGAGEGLSPEARQTAIAERGGLGTGSFGLNPVLLNAVITFLNEKVQ